MGNTKATIYSTVKEKKTGIIKIVVCFLCARDFSHATWWNRRGKRSARGSGREIVSRHKRNALAERKKKIRNGRDDDTVDVIQEIDYNERHSVFLLTLNSCLHLSSRRFLTLFCSECRRPPPQTRTNPRQLKNKKEGAIRCCWMCTDEQPEFVWSIEESWRRQLFDVHFDADSKLEWAKDL